MTPRSRLTLPFVVAAAAMFTTQFRHAAAEVAPRPLVERLADLPVAVAGGGLLALADGRLVYAGGTAWEEGEKRWLTEAFLYDPAADRWEAGPPLPAPADATVPLPLQVDGQWVMIGGETDEGVSNRAVTLVEQNGQMRWQMSQGLPLRKSAAFGGVLGDTVFVVGGADDRDSYASGETTVWAGHRHGASPAEWTWQRLDEFPGRAHSVAGSAVYGERLYIFGGFYDDHGTPRNSDETWSYSRDDGWQRRRPMPVASRGVTAVGVGGVGIVLVGGWSDSALDQILLYSPDADTYERIGTLPVPLAVASGVAVGRDVYVAGNEDKPRSRRPDFLRLRFPPDRAAVEPPRDAED